jgi:hypothetical protein
MSALRVEGSCAVLVISYVNRDLLMSDAPEGLGGLVTWEEGLAMEKSQEKVIIKVEKICER